MAHGQRSRRCLTLGIGVLALLSAGCFGPQRTWVDDLVWSPGGERAALLLGGLRLSDREGNLTPLLDDRAYRITWLGDGDRLLLARSRTVTTFAEVAVAVGPERTRDIVAEAEHLFRQPLHAEGPPSNPSGAVFAYLREQYPDALRAMVEDDSWFADTSVELHLLNVAGVIDGRLVIEATLYEDLWPIKTIRPAPDGRVIAFLTENEEFMEDDRARIFVVPVDASAPPALVDTDTGEFADWTADGRSLVYFSESGRNVNIGSFGCLARRELIDAEGAISVSRIPACLVDLVFERDAPVRSLRDGRVLFTAAPFEFPTATACGSRVKRLFSVDLTRSGAPVTPLLAGEAVEDEAFGFFDVSPDGARIVYSSWVGHIRVLTLSDGRTELLPLGLYSASGYVQGNLPRAVWSGSDALTYVRRIGFRNEFILRRGNSEIVLSRNWPEEVLPRFPMGLSPDPVRGQSPDSDSLGSGHSSSACVVQ